MTSGFCDLEFAFCSTVLRVFFVERQYDHKHLLGHLRRAVRVQVCACFSHGLEFHPHVSLQRSC